GDTTVTSGGWLPESDVTLQLTDAAGDPVGDEVVVTTDADGNVPADTTLATPEDAEAGDVFDVVGTDDNGVEVSAPVEIIAPTIEATSPVPAGGETEVTSDGWAPEDEVTLQLEDAAGDPVGDAVTVPTDADGSIPATPLPVPEDATPGDHTVTGTDTNGNEVSAPLEVTEAGEPIVEVDPEIPAGVCAEITSSGWAPDSSVTFTLVDEAGETVTEVTFDTDADGNVVADGVVCIEIPADADPGDHTVVGEDEEGNTGEDTTSIYTPMIEATSPVPAGEVTEITSGGWLPESDVDLQLQGTMAPVVPVTTDADGNVPAGTTITVPEGTPAGDYLAVGTDENGAEVSAPVEVYAPSLEAESPVMPGDESEITSGGWQPNSPVELQLVDPDGNPVGDPITVITDENGDVPAGTVVPIPADAQPGDYTIIGSDEHGAEVPADLVVILADAPVLEASSPVPAGGETTIASSGWTPDSEVTLTLADPDGNVVATVEGVPADEQGYLADGTTIPVPEDAAAAAGYTVTGVGVDDETASDEIEVYAPVLEVDPVAPGECAEVTSSGWLPGEEVTLQLVDPEGDPVGEPVVVIADENGDLPEGTCVPVPEDATPGDDYTVEGDGDGGAHVEAPLPIAETGDGPTIDATSPVPAGGATEITSEGWTPGTDVMLELLDSEGTTLGDPVIVTTDVDGAVPAGTMLAVPADATAGAHTVTAIDTDGVDVETGIEVYAPALDASSPVVAGGQTAITSGGWLPESEVTIHLFDADGGLLDETTVTTDAEGAVPTGTTLTVPADTEVDSVLIVHGMDTNGAEAADEITVVDDADGPVIDATSPVVAGADTSVSGSGWTADTEVTLALSDADGEMVGDTVTVTTDADGNVPAGTMLTVPADTALGTYTVTGTDVAGNMASDDIGVYSPMIEATSPVKAGDDTEITSGGWFADSQVSLQLHDAEGDAVGAPVTVTVDADGNVPAGTTLTVPASAVKAGGDPVEYTVVATDEYGVSVDAPVTVTEGSDGGNGGGDGDGNGNGKGDLPATGGEIAPGIIPIALLTLLLGAALIARSRAKAGIVKE
uniref:hypothetical protein n=1 Tax=Microbacterium karelineae TaxID=2654283 RepID=UPI003F680316